MAVAGGGRMVELGWHRMEVEMYKWEKETRLGGGVCGGTWGGDGLGAASDIDSFWPALGR